VQFCTDDFHIFAFYSQCSDQGTCGTECKLNQIGELTMLDFFGRVICPQCKATMRLEKIERGKWATQAIFKCTSPSCYDVKAVTWRKPRSVVITKAA
jgi:hypothetical protein